MAKLAVAIVVVIVAGGLCFLLTNDDIELDGTEGMAEAAGEFQSADGQTIKYRIFRGPRQTPDPTTELLLKTAVSRVERYMGTEFPAKTVVLVFTDNGISGNRLGHFRALPGASVFGQLSHSLSATWMRMEVRPDLEDGSDSLMDVLTHEVAHYYWHHRFASRAGQKFDLDEGAAHFLEYKLGGNEEVRMSAQLAAVCQGIYRSEETSSSQWRSIISILDPDLSDAQIRWLQSSEEFIEQVLGVCRQREFLSRYGSAGAFIQAEEIMGASLFRQAFREVWESSKDDALDAPDVRDALCARTTWGKCEAITAAFAAYGFEP